MFQRLVDSSPRLQAGLMVSLVFTATFLAHWPGVAGAVLWDDPAHLTRVDLRSWEGLWRIFTQIGSTQEFYPILHGAFWLEHRLWGDYLPAYHILNIVLHAASACLLGALLGRIIRSQRVATAEPFAMRNCAAFISALLFALHPVTVESVAWMTEQKNTLSIFFSLLALHAHLQFVETRRRAGYILGLVLFLLALGAKTATVVVAPAALVLLWWRNGRLDWRRDVVPLLPWFALAIAAGLVTIHVETNHVGAKGDDFQLTLFERAMLSNRILWFYVGKLIWPEELIFFYPRWSVQLQASAWWPYAFATCLVTGVLVALRRWMRGPLASWLLFVGVMFPVIGFLNVFAFVFSFVADHFQYMPCAVACAAAGGGLAHATQRLNGKWRAGISAGALLLCVLFGVLTFRQSRLYLSNETLFGDVVARNPESWMAHQILAVQFAKEGRSDEAMRHYRQVLALKPDHPDAYLGLALELQKQGGVQTEAIALMKRAVELRPQFFEAHYNLGVTLNMVEPGSTQALVHLRTAANLRAEFAVARHALGIALGRTPAGLAEALQHLERAAALAPSEASFRRDFADALARAGRAAESVPHYNAALELNPADPVAHSHYADVLLLALRRATEAVNHYRAALRLDPDQVDARIRLATVLAQQPGGISEAREQAEWAARLAPRNPSVRNTLGIIAAQQGDLVRAEAEWEAALAADPGFEDAQLNLKRLRELPR